MSSPVQCPGFCCCSRPLLHRPAPESQQRFVPGPPDPASASSFQLYRPHHFHLDLEMRPNTRDLSCCLVLELSPLVPGGPALVLDTHPVVKINAVRCRRGRHDTCFGNRCNRANQPCTNSDPARCVIDTLDPASSETDDPLSHGGYRHMDNLVPADIIDECKCSKGCSRAPGRTQTAENLWWLAQDPSMVTTATSQGSSMVTSEPLDLSVSQNANHLSFSQENTASSAGPIVNGHQPSARHLNPICHIPLNSLATPYSPTTNLSFSPSTYYTLTPDSHLSPTLPHFQPSHIPIMEKLHCTFSQPCDHHDESGPPPCTCCFPLDFRVDDFTDYGSALTITVPETLQTNETFQVIVHYETGEGPAVWWLDPKLSYGTSELFVFTQGHSVCNRSFFPCFDTPSVKCTYSATVKAPEGIRVLMSCTHSFYLDEQGTYHFYMEHPVPAYLVALIAGHLHPADVGPRSTVWAEPCVLPLAVGKLAGRVEQWLQAAESLYGPYIWGRYDIVFLPPSFPIVAMENPCLTFVICSILDSEDFLLIDVIHEIAHGWFGNAVTNASWEEMWLSEGLATYAQRRITTLVYGASFTCLETTFRLEALHRQIRILGQDTPFSRLQAKLDAGVNPSNLMNLFTYEKGFCFVHYLSQLCGDQDNFDAFLRVT